MRTTFADVKASRIPEALNIGPTDTRLAQYVNECLQRLIPMGHWHGTTQRYRISVDEGMITMPPQVAAIERVAVNTVAVPLRDQWYEFIDSGPYTQTTDSNAGVNAGIYQGRYPTFLDIVPSSKKVRLVCDLTDDVSKEVLVLGYDDSGNWIRSETTPGAGDWFDGEIVTLAASPGTLSTSTFATITDIQLPETLDGQVWLYEYDTVLTTQRLIGQYQYWERRPSYARYYFPLIMTDATTVDAIVKLDFIPIVNDTDYLIIGNLGAIKLGCMAIKAEEEGRFADANLLWYGGRKPDGTPVLGAVTLLNQELAHYRGDGVKTTIQVTGSGVDGTDIVQNLL